MNITPCNKGISTDLTQGFRLAGKIWVPFRSRRSRVPGGLEPASYNGPMTGTRRLLRCLLEHPGSAAVGSQQGVGRGSIHDFNPILPIEVRVVGLEEPEVADQVGGPDVNRAFPVG